MTSNAPANPSVPFDVTHALASMQTGALLECAATGPARLRLEGLAATVPSLFAARDLAPIDELLSRLGNEGEGARLRDVLFVSGECVHVVKPLWQRRGVALLATSPATHSVGLVLSAVRELAASLGEE